MLRPLFLLLAGALLCACAHEPEPPSPEARIDQMMAGAYHPVRQPVDGWHAQWTVDGEALDVDWLAPVQASSLPVILYLPGLGDDSRAGEPWRRAWAEAGYAVLSVQPQRHGRSIYASQEAQVGVFHGIAQRAYADAALQRRLRQLDQVLSEARRRSQVGDGDFVRIDWSRQVVAGFDLGTQTATALLSGQHGWQPQAAILLSPYWPPVELTDQIKVPLLTVTGLLDEDPFGWVMPAQRHQVLWQRLAKGDSYQLLLDRMSHAQLGGVFGGGPGAGEKPAVDEPRARPEGGARGPGGGGGPGGPGGGGRGGPGGDVFISRAGHGQGMQDRLDPGEAAAVQAVGVAFLDATLRRSAEARTWLQRDAGRWLVPGVHLEHRP